MSVKITEVTARIERAGSDISITRDAEGNVTITDNNVQKTIYDISLDHLLHALQLLDGVS